MMIKRFEYSRHLDAVLANRGVGELAGVARLLTAVRDSRFLHATSPAYRNPFLEVRHFRK
jgi:hypothetical protein